MFNYTHPMCTPHPLDRTYLYRLYDAADRLLYIGQSKDPEHRIRAHRITVWDWQGSIDHWSIEEFPTRQRAMQEEREAIRAENPIHNLLRYRSPAMAQPERTIPWGAVRYEIFCRWKDGSATLQDSLEQLAATGMEANKAARKLGVTTGTTIPVVLQRNAPRVYV